MCTLAGIEPTTLDEQAARKPSDHASHDILQDWVHKRHKITPMPRRQFMGAHCIYPALLVMN